MCVRVGVPPLSLTKCLLGEEGGDSVSLQKKDLMVGGKKKKDERENDKPQVDDKQI